MSAFEKRIDAPFLKKIQQMSTQTSTLIYLAVSICTFPGLKGNSFYEYNVIIFRKYFFNKNKMLMS